ncbi:MAG TPA: RNA methyltransferase [Bacteroidales bacterium]|nr:RNA methyltransferase [Bacteroidales bacterium]
MEDQLIEYLETFVTERRANLIKKILELRTRYLTVAVENIYQTHNASAVLRTCDCFGIQDVHIIEGRNAFTVNPEIAMGASKWLSIHKYENSVKGKDSAIESLKNQGYRIVATTPHTNDQDLEKFNLQKGKAAFIFGTELNGISDEVLSQADEFVKIPMVGFTESFNISVSVAIVLHHLSSVLRKSKLPWQLTAEEKKSIQLKWLKSTIRDSDQIVENFLEKKK